jgi:hypothetical protein
MVKSVYGTPNPLVIQSIDGRYAAVQPHGGREDRPIWLPLSVMFEWDTDLSARIIRAYNDKDEVAVNAAWREAKQLGSGQSEPGMVRLPGPAPSG